MTSPVEPCRAGLATPPGNARVNHIKSIGQLGIMVKLCHMPPYPTTAPAWVRRALLAKKEIALLDVHRESQFARDGTHGLRVLVP